MSRASLPREVPLTGPSDKLILALDWLCSVACARWGVIAIFGAFIVANLIVSPLFESAMIDDWSYGLMVKRLVEDHRFDQIGWTAVTLISQTLWGAIFSLPFGFSFGALHLSTSILSVAGLLALYATGKELGLDEAKSALISLTMLVNPVYFSLSYTFMSEVPSTALMTIALWLYVKAARRQHLRWWLLGSVACTAALLARQTGIFVGIGAAVWLLWQRSHFSPVWKAIAAATGIPALALLGFSYWLNNLSSIPEGYVYNATQLAKLPADIALRNVLVLIPVSLFYLGLFSLPYLAGLFDDIRKSSNLHRWVGILAALSAAVSAVVLARWFGFPMPFLRFGSMLNPAGIGPNNLLGERPLALDGSAQWTLTGLAALGAGVMIAIGLRNMRLKWLSQPSPAGLIGFVALLQLLWVLFGYLYLWDWFLFDRYYLPMLPPLLLLLASATRRAKLRWQFAVPIVALFGLFSLMGTHDWIAYRQAAWAAAGDLVEQGVPLRAIDAGFEWDGWQLYEYSQSHPDEWHHADASPFWIGRRVAPVITSEYVISFSPIEGYAVMDAVPYMSWLLRGERSLFVLRQQQVNR